MAAKLNPYAAAQRANCINMHTAEAREKGESEQRILALGLARGTVLFRV